MKVRISITVNLTFTSIARHAIFLLVVMVFVNFFLLQQPTCDYAMQQSVVDYIFEIISLSLRMTFAVGILQPQIMYLFKFNFMQYLVLLAEDEHRFVWSTRPV